MLMREAARRSTAHTWWQLVGHRMAGLPGARLLEVWEAGGLKEEAEAATKSAAARKAVLRRYRREVVRPALREYDHKAFASSADRFIPALGTTFRELQPGAHLHSRAELVMEIAPLLYRLWAVCRFTGCWPLQAVGGEDMPRELVKCDACGGAQVPVSHAFCACEGTLALFRALQADAVVPSRESEMQMVMALFGPKRGAAYVRYVGRALLRCVGRRGLVAGGGG